MAQTAKTVARGRPEHPSTSGLSTLTRRLLTSVRAAGGPPLPRPQPLVAALPSRGRAGGPPG
eukprot:15471188-Alexandrium_andersonii.AAC.1